MNRHIHRLVEFGERWGISSKMTLKDFLRVGAGYILLAIGLVALGASISSLPNLIDFLILLGISLAFGYVGIGLILMGTMRYS